MTDEQLVEQSKARDRARRERKRRDAGVTSRAAYLSKLKANPKPWLAEGVSRRTWFRRKARSVALGSSETIVCKERKQLVPLRLVESQKGYREGVLVERPKIATEAVEMASEGPSESALRHDLMPDDSSQSVPDPYIAALGNWGLADQRKRFERVKARFDAFRDPKLMRTAEAA